MLLSSAPQLLERILTLSERLLELLNDKNQKSLSGILANVDRLSDSLADRGPEIAATIAETRVTLKQAGIAAEKIGNLAQTVDGQAGPLITDMRGAIASANRSMNTLDATLKDAQPGVQAFSKQTPPKVGQLVRTHRGLCGQSMLSSLEQGAICQASSVYSLDPGIAGPLFPHVAHAALSRSKPRMPARARVRVRT